MSLPVAILAGGLATRLRPITENIPKSLVEIGGRPFIIRQLEYLRFQGIARVVLCLGYLGEQVEMIVGDGSDFGLMVSYSYDGNRLLGTGGALKQALPFLGDQFFVLYGDSYLPIDFREVERHFLLCGQRALITVFKNDGKWDNSNVLYKEGRLLEYNKQSPKTEMTYVDYGLGVLSSSVLENAPANEPFDLADIYFELSKLGLLAGYEVFERYYEIGSYNGLHETITYFNQMTNYELHSKTPK